MVLMLDFFFSGRDEEGQAVTAAAQAIAQAEATTDDYDSAPTCTQDGPTVLDQSGRRWGYENDKSCAVR
jgi:hypothetical protein